MWHSRLEIAPLLAADHAAIRLHWLSLPDDDRHSRFGACLSDTALWQWMQRMDWSAHLWWGAWLDLGPDGGDALVGVLQLTPTTRLACWEIGLSVQGPMQRQGIGTRLLASAVARMPHIQRFLCLRGHSALRAMARRLCLRINCDHAEVALTLERATAA